MSDLCEYLQWDSEFFDRRIGRVSVTQLTTCTVGEIISWCEANQVDCLYYKSNISEAESLRLAETNGFHLVDVRVTLKVDERILSKSPPHVCVEGVRCAHPLDIPALRRIAACSHRASRFYFDAHFLPERCDELYSLWIEKSCQGYADEVFVSDLNGECSGYLTCHLDNVEQGHIGLMAVDAAGQGRGIGAALLATALNWFREHDVKSASVVTQGRNILAQRFYQNGGFRTSVLEAFYHRWRKPSGLLR